MEWLQANKVPAQFHEQIADSFTPGTIRAQVAGPDMHAVRQWGGTSPEVSYYLNPAGASTREILALPPSNTMEHTTHFRIQDKTPYLDGQIAPNFGHQGGGRQHYVPNLDRLEVMSRE